MKSGVAATRWHRLKLVTGRLFLTIRLTALRKPSSNISAESGSMYNCATLSPIGVASYSLSSASVSKDCELPTLMLEALWNPKVASVGSRDFDLEKLTPEAD